MYDFVQVKEEYRAFCAENPPGLYVFQQPWWLDAAAGPENWGVCLYKQGGQISGAWPFHFKRYGKKLRIFDPPFTQFTGIWLKYPENQKYEKRLAYEKEVSGALLAHLESLPLIAFSQSFSADYTNWQPLYWKGFQQTTSYSFRIGDISDPAVVEAAFGHAKRKNIKRALNEGLTVGFDLPAREFYENHVLTLAKQGARISYPFGLFRCLYEAAYEHGGGRTIFARDGEGNLHAALFVIWTETCAFDLISTIDPDYRNSGASTLLVRDMIRYLSDKAAAFDFEGSMIEGVANSFSQFGTIQKPYFHITKTYDRKALLLSKIQNRLNSALARRSGDERKITKCTKTTPPPLSIMTIILPAQNPSTGPSARPEIMICLFSPCPGILTRPAPRRKTGG